VCVLSHGKAPELLPLPREQSTVAIHHCPIRLGKKRTEDELVVALDQFGSETMAEEYPNRGKPKLERAASRRAGVHGYTVMTTPGVGGGRLGRLARRRHPKAARAARPARDDTRVTWAGLVRRNLLRRPARTALTAAGVALGVALIVALLSITQGVRNTAEELVHVGRADFGLFQGGVSDFTRSLLPESLEREVAAQPGVSETAALFLHVGPADGNESFLLFGMRPDEFAYRRLVVVAGRAPAGEELLLGKQSARAMGLEPGETLELDGRRFTIAGIYASGDRFEDVGGVLPLRTVQRLARRPGEITTIGVTVAHGRTPGDVAAQLERRFPGVTAVVQPGEAVKVDTSSRLVLSAGWVVAVLALVVGGIGVTNTMAMSVFERVREIGILRAVGWSGGRIAGLVVSEALALCLLALAGGVGLGILAAHLFTRYTGLDALIAPDFTAAVFGWGLGFALAVGLLGAVYPAWRAIRLTPVAALRRA
jgi:putative ABC transport system permease protein